MVYPMRGSGQFAMGRRNDFSESTVEAMLAAGICELRSLR